MTEVRQYLGKIITIDRHILEEQAIYPDATGALTNLLYDMALAGKLIASRTHAGRTRRCPGRRGHENVQGEEVQKLDVYAQRTIFQLNDHTGRVCIMASEEHDDMIPIPAHHPQTGRYVLLYDPLDGSSNIEANVIVGTIFAIYRAVTPSGRGTLEDVLQPGARSGRGGLRDLRLEHDAGLLHRARRAWLHARSQPRRVSAHAPGHSHPVSAEVLQRQPGL